MSESVNSSQKTMVGGTNVQVAVRCRPPNADEKKGNQPTVVSCESETKAIKLSYGPLGKKIAKTYNFDKVFGMYSTQEEVFETMVRPIVDECLAGFNCTIFAYGQTGTGKTHTMEGDIHSEENAGIVPRSVRAILEQLETSGSEFTIRVSFLELYNEELQDLLNISGEKKLKLCEDIKKGVVCQNLEEITVLSVGDIFEILQRGIQERQTAETLCNKNSSRSHSIFTMKIMIKEYNVDGEEVVRHGQLNLVDLAGSECIGRSGAKNDRAREAGSINQSLLTLGRVITALVDHHGHIPYRDSKLTRLLQESLGGKAKTCIIATLSPSQSAVEETMSTLDYAYRAKNIKNQPTVNQKMTKRVVLKEYCAEIEQLKSQLQITREKNGVYVAPDEFFAMEAKLSTQENQINECESALRSRNEEVKSLRSERDDLAVKLDETQSELLSASENLEKATDKLKTAETELQTTQVELYATEAVVTAQVETETTLHTQGADLHNEIENRREDVTSLLGKVDRLLQKESDRVQETQHFVGEISASKTALLESLSTIVQSSQQESHTLCEGVSEMLTKGRTTCDSLKEATDGALSILIGDATAARVSMTNSCEGLETHLQTTNTHIGNTLKKLQSDLSAWLGEVDNSMKGAQQRLAKQQTQLDELMLSITTQANVQQQLCTSFLGQQETISAANSANTQALKSQMQSLFAEYENTTRSEVEEAKKAVESKALAMEQTMNTMLREMVQNTLQAFTQTASSASAFASTAGDAANKGIAVIELSQANAVEANKENIQTIFTSARSAAEQFAASVNATKTTGTETDKMLSAVSGDVGAKRDNLDETVVSLVRDVDSAIQEGCVVVTETKNTADTVLQYVTTASEKMTTSANTAMDSFVAFMDGKGDDLHKQLGTHFEVLQVHYSEQQGGVVSIGERVTGYGDVVVEAVDRPTGSTPRKSTFAPLQPLAATDSHEAIKSTARLAAPACGHASSVVQEEVAGVSSIDSASDGDIATENAVDSVSIAGDDEDGTSVVNGSSSIKTADDRLSQSSSVSSSSSSSSRSLVPDAPSDTSSKISSSKGGGRKKFGAPSADSERENANPNNSRAQSASAASSSSSSGLPAPSKSSRQLLRTKSSTDVEGTA